MTWMRLFTVSSRPSSWDPYCHHHAQMCTSTLSSQRVKFEKSTILNVVSGWQLRKVIAPPGHKIHLFVSFSPIPHQYLVTSWTLSLKLLSCFRLVCTYWLDYSSIHIHFLGSSPRMYKWWNYFFSQWEQSMRRSPDICYTGLIHCAFCIRSLPDLQDSGLLVYRDTLIIEDINDFKTMLDPAQKNIQIPWSAEPPPWHHYFSVLFLPSTLGLPLYSKVKHVIDR